MPRFVLLLGLCAALLAAGACAQRPETPLTQAAVRNDVAALRQLLHDGHQADEGGESWTALIWASRSGSIDAINGGFRPQRSASDPATEPPTTRKKSVMVPSAPASALLTVKLC